VLEVSKAPDGRLNLKYDVAGKENEVRELPLRYMVVGNFTGDRELPPIEERDPVAINQTNFDEVMTKLKPKITATGVANVFADAKPGEPAAETRPLELEFNAMADFHPDSLLRQLVEPRVDPRTGRMTAQIEALAQALKLREALVALRGPMGNRAAFRKAMEEFVKDDAMRAKLEQSLGIAR
jgi:type VI secretion system protein ImpB